MFKKLTGTQWLGIIIAKLTLVILLLAALAGAGCGTLGLATEDFVRVQVAAESDVHQRQYRYLDREVATNIRAIAKVHGQVTAAGEKIATVETKVAANTAAIAGHGRDLADIRSEIVDVWSTDLNQTRRIEKAERKLVTVTEMAGALSSYHRDAKAKRLVADWVRQYGGMHAVMLTNFPVGSDNVEAALKNAPAAVRDKVDELKKLVDEGKAEVLVAAGLQDAIPCKDKKCEDLAVRRAEALGQYLDAPEYEVVSGEQPKSVIERGGELRLAVVVWKEVKPTP